MRRSSVAAIAVLMAMLPAVASAAPGEPDASFGHDGKQTVFAGGAVATAVAIDHHDRIVIAGYTSTAHPDVALARLTPSGRLDATFGDGGKVVTDLGADDYAFDMAIGSDGGIVVVGERSTPSTDRVFVQRYAPNGTLDLGFGDGGMTVLGFGRRFQTANAVALTPAGRIVIAGSTSNGITSRSAVARFLRDGRLDDTFGDDGRVTTDVSPSGEQLTDVTVQPDGRIVAVGWAEGSLVPSFSAVRYLADGRLDDGFDFDGVARMDVSVGSDKGLGVALQPDGSLVIVGSAAANGRDEWGLVRVGPHGHLDDTFGDGGSLVTRFGPGFDEAAAVSVQRNGRLVVAGSIRNGSDLDMGLLRLKPGGRRDLTFGAGGRVLCDFAGGSDAAWDLTIQTDGKIVVVGEAVIVGVRRFGVARFLSTQRRSPT
jgi:uncharacterized delta-60 repeat protein